jgi:hypothetical protein
MAALASLMIVTQASTVAPQYSMPHNLEMLHGSARSWGNCCWDDGAS